MFFLLIFNLLYLSEYTVVVFKHTRRGHWISQPSTVGSDALCWSAGAHADRALIHKIYKQILRTIKKEKPAGAREMAHWLRALAALAEARV